jgi:hypothetical protein
VARVGDSAPARWIARALARSAGVERPEVRWRLEQKPTFDNQFATLEIDGPSVTARIHRILPGEWEEPKTELSLERRLA